MNRFIRKVKDHLWWRFRKTGITDHWDDETFIRRTFRWKMGKRLNLDNPQTFNEKIQWLKLNDHNPEYTKMVDKVEVKKYIAGVIGDEFIIPTLGIWECFDDIDFDTLPNQFVLKCTHDSGGVVICKEKSTLNKEIAKEKIEQCLKRDYYLSSREWPYKNISPRILAEQYLVDESGFELKDYKLFVFNGDVYYIQVDYDRFTDHHRNFYNTKWEYIPFTTLYPTNAQKQIKKPESLEKMIELAEKIADIIEDPPFVRIDLYSIKERIYFGEVTFYHGSGCEPFIPPEYDQKLGNLIHLKSPFL